MKLGVSSFSYGWAVGVQGFDSVRPMRLMDLIETTRDFGLSLLQIGDNLPLHTLGEQELADARDRLEQYGIELEVGTRGLTEETLERYLDIAAFFHSKLLRIVIDQGDYAPREERIVSLLRAWMPRFEHAGVRLAIENHDRFEAKDLERILRYVHNDYLGICLDTANSLGALEGVETVSECLTAHTINLHIKDVRIRRLDSQLGFVVEGAAAGEGSLDVRALIQRVRHNGRDPNCVLELWTPFAGDTETTIAHEAAAVARSVALLRPLVEPAPFKGSLPFGASAAHTISRAGARFTMEDILCSMRALGERGFSTYQPELSFESAMDEWEQGGLERVNRCQRETGVKTRQLICHFVLDYFSDASLVCSDAGYSAIERFVSLADRLEHCDRILFPIGPLASAPETPTLEYIDRLRRAYRNKLFDFARMAQKAGLMVSFELLPDNFFSRFETLFSEMSLVGLTGFGVNFDTGHAIANGEDIYRLARDYGAEMLGTHLCDPKIPRANKDAPGQGMIDWTVLLDALLRAGYAHSLDLEIMASPEACDAQYALGLAYLQQALRNREQ